MRIVADRLITWIEEAFTGDPSVSLQIVDARAITQEMLRDADVLLVRSKTRVDHNLVCGTRVKFVGSATVGIDHVDLQALANLGITFLAAPGSSANSVAEFTWAMIVAASHRLGRPWKNQTLAVIGAGAIGEQTAHIGELLGLKVLRYDPPLAESGTRSDITYCSRHDLKEADLLAVHLPLERNGPHATFQLVDHTFLRDVKPGCLLVNTSRGDVINEKHLLEAHENGVIGGFALDVFADEPAVKPEILRRMCLGTPHVAGRSLEGMSNNTRVIVEALSRFRGQTQIFDPRPFFPANPEFPEGLSSLEELIEKTIGFVAMTQSLSRSASADSVERGRVFERVRTGGALRRDLSSYSGRAELPADVREFIDALAFHRTP